jgi:D-alanyl-D-alanine dipeptidase
MSNIEKKIQFVCLGVFFTVFSYGHSLEKLEGERFHIDLRYQTKNNFLKTDVYAPFGLTDCFLRKEMVTALKQLVEPLEKEKIKLLVWDCYRPLKVQMKMWELVPDPRYVADPKVGSNHNRGAAIDVALVNERGITLGFPTGFDDFSEKAHQDYRCKPTEKELCANRDQLKKLMVGAGLRPFPTEWWHYELQNAEKLPLISQND